MPEQEENGESGLKLSDSYVTVRKEHLCWGCQRPILRDAIAHRVVSADVGKAASAYWCPVCDEVMKSLDFTEDDTFAIGELRQNEPYVWERIRFQVEEAKP